MAYKSISILGFRGFSTEQTLSLAVPDGENPGSGFTTIVGPNNAGKSTITEAFRALVNDSAPSIMEGRRNKRAGDRIAISITDQNGNTKTIESLAAGGSDTRVAWAGSRTPMKIFSLPSRRYFNPYFGKNVFDRNTYVRNDGLPSSRAGTDEKSAYRLFAAQQNLTDFNKVLGKILNPIPNWTIDQHDTGSFYLKFRAGDATHSSEGMGEGLVSLLLIVDALYDSQPGDTIVIDEPELSLHPALQRKLADVLREYSKDRQIICSTHSPYFVDPIAVANGGAIARVHLDTTGGSVISQLGPAAKEKIAGLLNNLNNPHVLGLDAREVFFLQDKIILVEGQEDAIFYPKIAEQLELTLLGDFYGWGVGGAGNMGTLAQILSDLGFRKVFGVLDSNRKNDLELLRSSFPEYQFEAIATDDVRDKSATAANAAINGLTDSSGKLHPNHVEDARAILKKINEYLSG